MRSNFLPSYNATRIYEGGNVDDKADRGGRTSRGVTQTTYDDYRRSKGQAKGDVFLMTEDEAHEIYLTRYWTPTDCDFLAVGVDFAAWDWSVNSGVSRGKAAGAKVHNLAPVAGVQAICAQRTSFVNGIKNFAKFRKGVLSRVAKVEALGVKMALAAAGDPQPAVMAVLQKEGAVASTKATSAATKAKATTVPATGGAVTVPVVADHMNAGLVIGLCVFGLAVCLVAAYFVYQHVKHSERADAYAEA